MLRTQFAIISVIHGGVFDLHPCLLSQFMQYPVFGLLMEFTSDDVTV
jgi:hypothetical protein